MITAAQLRAARAIVGMDQRALAEASGLSVPTIQRMEASDENASVTLLLSRSEIPDRSACVRTRMCYLT